MKNKGVQMSAAIFVLLIILAMGGCSGTEDTSESDSVGQGVQIPEPEGLFIFYRMGYEGGFDYGLVNEKGDIVQPFEYDRIEIVNKADGAYYYSYNREATSAEDRYFKVSRYIPLEYEEMSFRKTMYALMSPQGEFLTDFSYLSIVKFSDREGFIAAKPDEDDYVKAVKLDNSGNEEPLAEGEIPEDFKSTLTAYREMERLSYRYGGLLMDYISDPAYEDAKGKNGPDVPEQEFEQVIELKDGKYWGVYENAADRDDQPAHYAKYRNAELFDGKGNRTGDYKYNSISRLTDLIYQAGVYEEEIDDLLYLLVAPDGTPLLKQTFEGVSSWSVSPYIIAYTDSQVFIIGENTGEIKEQISRDSEQRVDVYRYEEGQYIELSSNDKLPTTIYDPETGKRMVLNDFPHSTISRVSKDGTKFILYDEGIEDTEDAGWREHLIDMNGKLLLSGKWLNFEGEYCVNMEYDDMGYQLYGLYDLDGTIILPQEFERMELLDGNALLVRRGDYEGIMDLKGNWIYKESIYRNLRD